MKRIFRSNRRTITVRLGMTALLGVLFFHACALPPPPEKIPPVRKDPFRDVPREYKLRALQNERKNNLSMAILCWHIVKSFKPGDLEATAEINRLRSLAQAESKKHYLQGLDYLKEKKGDAARNEFLLALFFNPDDRKILDPLEKDLLPPDSIAYRVTKGDNDTSIARKVYHDPGKSFLVAYFDNANNTDSPAPGELLHLPIIEPAPVPEKPKSVTLVQRAQTLLKAKKYKEAISLAEDVVAYGPSTEARHIINASYYTLAVREFRSGHLPEALKLFAMVNGNYEKTSDYIRRIRNQLHVMADYHYKKGVRYFVDEKLEKAIAEWKTTLRLNPEHARARADLEKARTMLKNLNGIR
jgi:tetratricopeptide (TPR) repeat protein